MSGTIPKARKYCTKYIIQSAVSCTVVWDETSWGSDKGIGKPQRKTPWLAMQGRVQRKEPARTIWNAGYKRRLKPMKTKRGPNPHTPTRWVWIAVLVGKGREVFTHQNKLKRISFRLLAKKQHALEGKPRGADEISETVKTCIKPPKKQAVL